MLRSIFGQLVSALVLGGILVGWWLAAGQDFSTMANQAVQVFMWVGQLFQPVISTIVDHTSNG